MPIKMPSWNSNDINHTSTVQKARFNQYKIHRVSVREPFTHITFYFSGRCSYRLCTWGNRTASRLLWKTVRKRSAPHNMLLRNQERRHLRLCIVSSLLPMNKTRYNEPKHLKYITDNRGLHSQNYLLLQVTIRCHSFFNEDLQKKKKAWAFWGLQGSSSASTLPCSVWSKYLRGKDMVTKKLELD